MSTDVRRPGEAFKSRVLVHAAKPWVGGVTSMILPMYGRGVSLGVNEVS